VRRFPRATTLILAIVAVMAVSPLAWMEATPGAVAAHTHPGKSNVVNGSSTKNEWICNYKSSNGVLTWKSFSPPTAGLPKAAMSTYWVSRDYGQQAARLFVISYGLVHGKWKPYEFTQYQRFLPAGKSKPPLTSFTGHSVKRTTKVVTKSVRTSATAWRLKVQVAWYKPTTGKGDGTKTKTITHYRSPQTSLGKSVHCANKITIKPTVPVCVKVCARGWGDNSNAELGDGQVTGSDAGSPTFKAVKGISGTVTDVAGSATDGYAVAGGKVFAWGDNSFGQLGDGKTPAQQSLSNVAVQVSGLTGVTAVASGGDTAYALTSAGVVYAWGSNSNDALGNGSTTPTQSSTPAKVQFSTPVTVKAIAAGSDTGYAVAGGNVYAWGDNSRGQLGNGSPPQASDTAVEASLSGTVTAVAGGANDGYALIGGQVFAWGSNSSGQLGTGQLIPSTPTPQPVPLPSGVTAIAGGLSDGYAVAGGDVYAWGDNSQGQLGDDNAPTDSSTPEVLSTLPTISDVVANFSGTAFAISTAHAVFAFGSNTGGALGDGHTSDQEPFNDQPVGVSGLGGVTAIAGGGGGYAIKSGKVEAWGVNTRGQLGIGVTYSTTAGVTTPAVVSSLTDVKQIVGNDDDGYAVAAGGVVFAWGSDSDGGLGDGGDPVGISMTPVPVGGALSNLTVTAIAVADDTTYALTTSHQVYAWGDNTDGEVGSGSATPSIVTSPHLVAGLTGVTKIAAGGGSAYALTSAGKVYGWGSNASEQLGTTVGSSSATPMQIAGLSGISQLVAGDKTAYALTTAGKVYAWGDSTVGQLGDGLSGTKSADPQLVTESTKVTSIAASGSSAYAMLSGGTVVAWGLNSSGQLGANIGTTTHFEATPVAVSGLTKVIAIAAGTKNGYAIVADSSGKSGTVRAWGDNSSGQLGNGKSAASLALSTTPVTVSGLSTVFAIAGTALSSYALVA
jgi:alpha-tubulin suppressor-like RCC1 family protein